MNSNYVTSGVWLVVPYEVACKTLYTPILLSKNSMRESSREDTNCTVYGRRGDLRRGRRMLKEP
jgi:hypothetical protein